MFYNILSSQLNHGGIYILVPGPNKPGIESYGPHLGAGSDCQVTEHTHPILDIIEPGPDKPGIESVIHDPHHRANDIPDTESDHPILLVVSYD